jgi:hypothetical protein
MYIHMYIHMYICTYVRCGNETDVVFYFTSGERRHWKNGAELLWHPIYKIYKIPALCRQLK